ncbi:MAG: glycosyltransferase family 4 protein [Deltaproteobacteria bacterium]|nr:glycosyltransferase family 4 protein [Deltaproteobacteria bacterium]
MTSCNILTDLRIPQSPLWGREADSLADKAPRLFAFIEKTPSRIIQKLAPILKLAIIIKFIHKYDILVTAGIKTGQLLALFRSIFRINKPMHIILELMLDEEREKIGWKIKRTIQRFLFSSVDMIFVSSSQEIETYSRRLNLPKNRFKFIHFHTNVIEPKMLSSSHSYVLSAGRTGRDFHTLVEAAGRLADIKFVIISDQQSATGLVLPKNIMLHVNIPREDYLRLVKECSFVVVPLQTLVKSTGQVVILEAMAYGKPVIATDAVGTKDYIQSGLNGIIVPPNDPVSLAKAIRQLADDASLHEKLSRNAFDFVKANCTFAKYVTKILDTACELLRPLHYKNTNL